MVVRKSDQEVKKFADKKEASGDVSYRELENVSLDIIEVTDYFEKGKAAFNRVYEVYDGEMQLTIAGQQTSLHKGDAVFIEKDMDYELKGTFKAVAINKTAF
jgi:mannose-6-phosphate isomerase class I